VLRRSGGARWYLIEVDAFIRSGRLLVQWTYGTRIHEERTIKSLADAQLDAIRDLLERASSREKRPPTAADFPLASLSQKQLDSIAAKIKIKRPKA
jgi:non-ribosomal peptide synthase protein (TIGR01720 family)